MENEKLVRSVAAYLRDIYGNFVGDRHDRDDWLQDARDLIDHIEQETGEMLPEIT